MWEAFQSGGWGMFPTLLAGLVLMGVSVRYAVAPRRALLTPLTALAALTLCAGALGFVLGFIKSVNAVGQMEEPNPALALIGAGEAAHCVALALGLTVLAGIAVSVGAFRVAHREE